MPTNTIDSAAAVTITEPGTYHGARALALEVAQRRSLEDLCQALAEGDHELGFELTRAGASVIQWPGSDCPWFHPGPTPVTSEDAREAHEARECLDEDRRERAPWGTP